jgi:hypothetical protein
LKDLARHLADKDQPPPPLSGRGVLTAQIFGVVPKGNAPAYQGLSGSGEFEILGGDFWRIPVMQRIADSVSVKHATTVGEAAGQFRLRDNKIHFDRVLANSPALGVEGAGDVGFDGTLDLKLVANPLGQWGERVGDLGDGWGVASILGKAQKGLDAATRVALYEVNVKGTTAKPDVSATPAPFISRQVSRLLGDTSDKSRKTGLLDTLHKNDNNPANDPDK